MCNSISFINSVADSGIWLIRNADDIRKVANVIAKATGSATSKAGTAPTANQLPVIYAGLTNAAEILKQIMDKVLPEDPSATSGEAGQSTTQFADLTGLWVFPSVSGSGLPGRTLYADIVNFMAMNGLQTIIGDSSNELDIAREVAGAVFSVAPQSQATTDPSTGIITLPFDVNAPGQGIDIHGVHVFYTIPLGFEQEDIAWQSHLRLKFSQTQKAIAVSEDKKMSMAFTKANDPAPPYNTTTIAVEWMSGVGTETMSKVQNAVAGHQGYTIISCSFSSIIYYYTVFTTIDIGPLAVAQAFTDAIQANNTNGLPVKITHKSIVLA
jgi:hypothetical protein